MLSETGRRLTALSRALRRLPDGVGDFFPPPPPLVLFSPVAGNAKLEPGDNVVISLGKWCRAAPRCTTQDARRTGTITSSIWTISLCPSTNSKRMSRLAAWLAFLIATLWPIYAAMTQHHHGGRGRMFGWISWCFDFPRCLGVIVLSETVLASVICALFARWQHPLPRGSPGLWCWERE